MKYITSQIFAQFLSIISVLIALARYRKRESEVNIQEGKKER